MTFRNQKTKIENLEHVAINQSLTQQKYDQAWVKNSETKVTCPKCWKKESTMPLYYRKAQ